MIKQTEKQIQNAMLDYLERRKIHCAQIDTVGIYDPVTKGYRMKKKRVSQKGVADILATYKGLALAIEVKRDKYSYPSYYQRKFLISNIEAGGVSLVVRKLEELMEYLKEIDSYYDKLKDKYVMAENRFFRMFSANLDKDFFK